MSGSPPFEPPPLPPPPSSARGPSWSWVEFFPVYFLALFGGTVVGVGITLLLPSCAPQTVLVSLVGELAFGAVTLFWVTRVNRAPVASLGLPTRPLGDLGIGVLGGIGLLVLGYAGSYATELVARLILGHSPVFPEQVPGCVRGGWLAAMGAVVVLVAPVCEEVMFRGYLFRGLRRRFALWPATLISGVVFGGAHFLPLLIPSLALVGIGLALVYERRQSLLASATAHATFNLFGIILIASSRVSGGHVGW